MPERALNPAKPMTVTVNMALSALQIGRTKFYELVNDGRIETVTIGRRRLVKYSSLERLAQNGAA